MTFSPFNEQPIIRLKLTAMYVQQATGRIKVLNTWCPLVEVSKVNKDGQHPEDRFFIDKPIPVPGHNYSRKSFLRTELQAYKKA